MSGFTITLDRVFITYEGKPFPVWEAKVNAEAYDSMFGQTPGEALRALGREFDDKFASEGRGHWEPEIDVRDVVSDGEIL